MSVFDTVDVAVKRPRWLSFSVFFAAGLLLFEFAFFADKGGGKPFQIAAFVGLPILFSVAACILRKSRRFIAYAPAFFSYAVVSISLFCMWLLDESPARWLGMDAKSPQGMALGKVSDAAVLILTVFVLTRICGVSLGSVFLQKGRLGLGIAVGLAGFAVMTGFGIWEARSLGVSMSRLIGWTPWLLIFVLSNGFFEELMFRGVFLKRFEPLLGPHLANLVTALVFAIGHAGVTYTADILTFVAITLVFALVWGYIMQKTGALWGSALFHAGADVTIMIGIFAGAKI
jgi:membrane protease YdiL (CAAX protease family)